MSNAKKAKVNFEELLAAAKLPEHTVRVCLRGDLVAEHEALEAELAALGEFTASHLAEADPRLPLAQRIRDLEQEMAAAERAFLFRALGSRKYRELMDAHPGKDGDRFNAETFPRALIAACAVDPEMTPTDVDRLFDVLNAGQVEALFMAAYVVNEGQASVPFSKVGSEVLRRLEPR